MNREITEVSEFLEWFSPISLHYKKAECVFDLGPRVFWNENEGSDENNSSSSCAADPNIQEKIISVFSSINFFNGEPLFGQFWAAATIGGRQILSTSGQPFAIWDDLSNELAKYRLYTENYKYNIDMNYKLDIDDMIISGGPATAFITRLPHLTQLQWIQAEPLPYYGGRLNRSVMLPVCFLSQSSSCIGVLELTFDQRVFFLGTLVLKTIRALNEAGLDVISAQHLIPFLYKDIHGLKLAKDEIQEALKVVCETHNLDIAQVWISYEDKSHVLSSSSLDDTQTKQLLAVKLTGYLSHVPKSECGVFYPYFRMCDVILQGIWSCALSRVELPLKTLQDYGSHYVSEFDFYTFTGDRRFKYSALTICLRSNYTGDFNYAFEFIWIKKSEYANNLVEGIILTLKRCLPRFKFASGAELGDQLEVLVTERYVYFEEEKIAETEKIKIFQGKILSPMPKAPEEGKNDIAPSNVMCKTTAKVLPREAIEKQFGKTMNEAAKNLNVSLSTFKRKFKELGIPEWPGPNFMKKKANDSSIFQIDTNEEDINGAIQEATTINISHNTLTIKAEHSIGMVKFHLPISQASFATIEQEIGMKLKLSVGTYMLNYLDEDGDWILLTSDEEMHDCIKSSTKSDRIVVKLRVLTSQQLSGPSGSFGI